jgi:Fe-S oxidoreductase
VSELETTTPFAEIVDEIRKAGGEAYKYCYQCGKCDVVCPWNRVRNFSIRKIVWQATLGVPDIEQEDIWRCTTCGSCPSHCPRGVEQIEVGVAVRRVAAGYGAYPDSVKPIRGVTASLGAEGNPLHEPRAKRDSWADGLGVKPFEEGMELLWFVGCYLCYDPRMKKVARATAKLLSRAGVDFGILGEEESCCGESIRKAGQEEVYRALAKRNIRTFIDRGVRRILVSSPHCYHTLQNEYREFMVRFEVVHVAEYLKELIDAGRLKLDGEFAKKVTWHDPCYLGRHNGVYDAPREVLGKLRGISLVEMRDTRRESLCCGGGGGRIWMETPKEERFSDLRVAQAKAAGAEVLATACPYCITNFEESRLAAGEGAPLEVRDITEILLEALTGGDAS